MKKNKKVFILSLFLLLVDNYFVSLKKFTLAIIFEFKK